MKGTILDFSIQTSTGVISGDDGNRYQFDGAQWHEKEPPVRGTAVDFDVQEGAAVAVYRAVAGTGATAGGKDRIAAGLLAIFLGALGIHKFYLGYTGPGLVYLLVNTIGWVVTIFLLGLPNIALGLIALIEGIIYLTKSDEEFQETYVVGSKPWF